MMQRLLCVALLLSAACNLRLDESSLVGGGDAGSDGAMGVVPAPVGHWRFDEGSGTVAMDSSGNGDNGTMLGAPTFAPGKVGAFALRLDGVSDRVAITTRSGNDVLSLGTGSFSYGAWVFVTASAGPYDMAWFKGGSSGAASGYDIELGTGSWDANISDGTTPKHVTFGLETLGVWVRLIVVVDRQAEKLLAYTNGVLVDQVDITGMGSFSTVTPAFIGSQNTGDNPFRGVIDDMLVFDSALTPDQVLALN